MTIRIPLRGPSGEPVDFARTVYSHGCTSLAPATHRSAGRYDIVLRIARKPLAVSFTAEGTDLLVHARGRLSKSARSELEESARRLFRLDADLQPFYEHLAHDPELGWAAAGAGRMLAGQTVFEDVVKTICTTNCAWSGTIRMVSALVETLGAGAFPTPQQMASAPLSFYTQVARAGYRGPYLRKLAQRVRSGALDLEALRPGGGLSDDRVEEVLLEIDGVGPYAVAHIMMLLGRHHRLVLDSWTRPTFARLIGKKSVTDAAIRRRFKRYGPHAGLAFWLSVTRDWLLAAPPLTQI